MSETGETSARKGSRRIWVRYAMRLRRVLRSDFVILSGLAAMLGAIVGYVALGFRWAILQVQGLGFGVFDENMVLYLAEAPWWRIILAPTAAGLVVGVILRYVIPERRPYGIADIMETSAGREVRQSLPYSIASIIVAAISLGGGASAGREGPIVHLGATVAGFTGRHLHLPAHLIRTLLGCGTAAAVAASFNAPLAGVFFALEVVIGHYAVSAFAPIVLAAVAATIVSRAHMGDFPAFIIPDYAIASAWEFPAFVILGLAGALTATIFMRSWQTATRLIDKYEPPLILQPAMAGLLVGIAAIWLPEILGVGYAATDAALKNNFGPVLLLFLLIAKVAATAICLAARFGGGVFSPSIFIGAMLGGTFGHVATSIFPELGSNPGLYAIVGMGCVAASVLGAPISTTLIVFELTGDYQITLALMVAVAVAAIATRAAVGGSFFHLQHLAKGIDLRGGRAEQLVRMARVAQAIQPDYATVPASTPIAALPPGHAVFLVTDDAEESKTPGSVTGILIRGELKGMLPEDATAGSLAKRPRMLEPKDSLQRAISIFDTTHLAALPVISDQETRQPAGVLFERDALRAYNRLLVEARLEEQGRFSRHRH